MAAWRKEEIDAATHHQKKRGNETEKFGIAHGRSVEFCEATPFGLVDEPKESFMGARRAETCVAPRYVDASLDFISFSLNEQRVVCVCVCVCGRCQTPYFVLFSLSSKPRAGVAAV